MSAVEFTKSLPAAGTRYERLKSWFETRPSLLSWLGLALAAFLFQLSWSAFGVVVVANLDGSAIKAASGMRILLEGTLLDVIGRQAPGVLFEEVAFRVIPLGIALAIYRDNGRGVVVAAIVLLSSVTFGYFHGLEWYRLALQAVGGIVLSIVYLKTCGMSGKFWMRALAASFAVHLAINTAILAVLRSAKAAG